MRIIFGIVILAILIFVFVFAYGKTKDIFSPLSFFAFYQFIRYVPIMLYNKEDAFYISLNDKTLLLTFCFEMLFVVSIVIGYSLFREKRHNPSKQPVKRIEPHLVIKIPLFVILLVFFIGFASRIYIIQKSGGILYVIHNMGNAYGALSADSNGYILALGNLITLAILMMIYKISVSKKKKRFVILLVLMIALGMLTFLVYSSRSPALEILLFAIFGYHYLIKKIHLKTLLNPKIIVLLLLIAVIIVIFPLLRSMSSGNSTIDYDNLQINSSVFDSVASVLEELSTVKIDTFVYNHFNSSNFWHGANFLNLFVAAIPSSIYLNKPCVDDGVYLCNIMYGYSVSPNAGRHDLVETYSMPFTTPSCMYANFGFIGIIAGGIILGIIYRRIYSLLKKNKNPFTILLYLTVIYQLELSTLSISQALIPIVFCGVAYYICCLRCRQKMYVLRPTNYSS